MNRLRTLTKKKVSYPVVGIICLVLIFFIVVLVQSSVRLANQNQQLRNAKEEFYQTHVSSDATTFFPGLNSEDIHLLINAERKKAGLAELAYNDGLEKSACAKADDMIQKNYWAHVAPDGTQPWYFFAQAGIVYRNAGENLGYGFADGDGVVQGWMNSKTHRENIMNEVYTAEGICVRHADTYVGQKNQQIIVQHFYREL